MGEDYHLTKRATTPGGHRPNWAVGCSFVGVFLKPEAIEALERLARTPALLELFTRLDAAIDRLEREHTSREARRLRYMTRPATWGIPVHGSGEDWQILWQLVGPDDVVIAYIGPRVR